MASSREIRRKIKSIRSTRQITRAMELVSAAKMKKAVHSATTMRTYASTALMLLTQLSERVEGFTHPLLAQRPIKKVLAVVFTSDRGLCGGFNTNLFKKVFEFEKMMKKDGAEVDYIAIGKKGQDFLARSGRNIVLSYGALTNHPKLADTLSVGKYVMDLFQDGTYDQIEMLYQNFISPLVQKPTAYQLLPFSKEAVMTLAEDLGLKHLKNIGKEDPTDYLFEPSPAAILGNLLPQLTQMQVFQAALETTASEHSARMVAMQSATNNANDFINDLTFHMNQVRQATITREISEISAGKIALEG